MDARTRRLVVLGALALMILAAVVASLAGAR
jgi:hypothetical protein